MGISRSDARKKAFQLIFQNSVNSAAETLDVLAAEEPELAENEYIRTVVCGVEEKQTEIDEIINAHLAKGRSISRLSRVVLAVLRLAVYEIMYVDDVPGGAAINEAVELTKEFGDDNEPRYVNGVLAAVLKDCGAV